MEIKNSQSPRSKEERDELISEVTLLMMVVLFFIIIVQILGAN